MKSKVIKKVVGLLFPILTLFMLSACNNRVDRDLAKTAISNIRSVVEAAGLEAEGYSNPCGPKPWLSICFVQQNFLSYKVVHHGLFLEQPC